MKREKQEMTSEAEERMARDNELDDLKAIEGKPVKSPRAVMSLRMSSKEMREVALAAAIYKKNVSEFVRDAALERAREVEARVYGSEGLISRAL